MIRAVVAGAAGRMGSRILAALRAEKDFAVVSAFERQGSDIVGRPVDGVTVRGSIEEALESGADVVVDFTAPPASVQHARACAAKGVALVVGTTGLSAEQKAELAAAAKRIALVGFIRSSGSFGTGLFSSLAWST